MTATGIVLLLTQIVTLIAAIMGLLKAGRAVAAVQEVHVLMNSRLTELLDVTRKSALAEGRKAEKDNPSDGQG